MANTQTATPPKLLTTTQYARLEGITPQAARYRVAAGTASAALVGYQYLIQPPAPPETPEVPPLFAALGLERTEFVKKGKK